MIKQTIHRKTREQAAQGKFILTGHGMNREIRKEALERQVSLLKRTLAQREHEVWTLKQLLLYR